jgi:hypothetical protein
MPSGSWLVVAFALKEFFAPFHLGIFRIDAIEEEKSIGERIELIRPLAHSANRVKEKPLKLLPEIQ